MNPLEYIVYASAGFLLRSISDLGSERLGLQASIAPGLIFGALVLSILLIGVIINGSGSIILWLAGLAGFVFYTPALMLGGVFLVWWNPEKYKEGSMKRRRGSARFVEDK